MIKENYNFCLFKKYDLPNISIEGKKKKEKENIEQEIILLLWTWVGAEILTTVCPRSSDSFYVVSYKIKWVTTSLTHSINFWPVFCALQGVLV